MKSEKKININNRLDFSSKFKATSWSCWSRSTRSLCAHVYERTLQAIGSLSVARSASCRSGTACVANSVARAGPCARLFGNNDRATKKVKKNINHKHKDQYKNKSKIYQNQNQIQTKNIIRNKSNSKFPFSLGNSNICFKFLLKFQFAAKSLHLL